MSTEEDAQIVKSFFAAMGRGDKQGLLALSAEGYGVDHSRQALAACRYAPRAHWITSRAPESIPRDRNDLPKTS